MRRKIKLPQLPQDKANHFIYGALIYMIASLWILPGPCLFITASVAFFKEFYDTYTDSSDFSLADFSVTCAGGIIIMIAQLIN